MQAGRRPSPRHCRALMRKAESGDSFMTQSHISDELMYVRKHIKYSQPAPLCVAAPCPCLSACFPAAWLDGRTCAMGRQASSEVRSPRRLTVVVCVPPVCCFVHLCILRLLPSSVVVTVIITVPMIIVPPRH
eukprot:GHVU01121525.1.p2 GENE.GHVU01121525.1~~GHVU01121525.1.p2  ORF type:complete len:132 (-),score=3.90 GHVU01121525.1:156-551(-)